MNRNTDSRNRLQDRFTGLLTIDAQQIDQPGYCSDIAAAIVNNELQMLASESRLHQAVQPDNVCSYSRAASAGKRG